MTRARGGNGDPADSRPVRRRGALALVPALLVAGAACAPFHAGAAAAVGNQRIDTSQLGSITAREISLANRVGGAADQGASAPDQKTVQQTALTELIQIKIMQSMAEDLGITVTANDIGRAKTAIIASNGGDQAAGNAALKGYDLDLYSELRAYEAKIVRSIPVSDSDIEKMFDQQTDHRQVRISEVDLPDAQSAQAFAAAATADPGRFAALAKQLTGTGPVAPAYYPLSEITQAAGSTPVVPFAVLGPLQSSATGGYVVLQVLSLRTETLPDALAPGSSERTAAQSDAFTPRYVAAMKRLGVHVSPRFGAWNAGADSGLGTVGALPPQDQLSRPQGSFTTAPAAHGSAGQ